MGVIYWDYGIMKFDNRGMDAIEFYKGYYELKEFPVDESTIKFLKELKKELSQKNEREFERLSLDNYKMRKMLIKEENELIHITMGKDKWRLFVEFLRNKRKETSPTPPKKGLNILGDYEGVLPGDLWED